MIWHLFWLLWIFSYFYCIVPCVCLNRTAVGREPRAPSSRRATTWRARTGKQDTDARVAVLGLKSGSSLTTGAWQVKSTIRSSHDTEVPSKITTKTANLWGPSPSPPLPNLEHLPLSFYHIIWKDTHVQESHFLLLGRRDVVPYRPVLVVRTRGGVFESACTRRR